MFSKTADPTAAPTAPSPRPSSGSNTSHRSVLAADLKITGDIRSDGSIELLGEVDGTLQAQSLVIGADGRMAGDISAEQLDVKGRHEGRVACQEVILRASAQVKADISYTTLVIESGAQVEGRFSLNKA